MSKYTVLHCFHKYLPTTENWAFNIIREIPDVKIIILSREYLRTNFYSKEFDYIEFPLKQIVPISGEKTSLINLANKFISLIRKSLYKSYIKRSLSNTKLDLMHSHFAMVGWDYLWLANDAKIPHVVSFYGFDYESLPHTEPVWQSRYQILFKEADLFLCEGSFGARVLHDMGCPEGKIRVSRLGVDLERIPFYTRTKKKGELKLLQIATLSRKKGHIYTVKAFAEALKTCPDMTLTIVGKDAKQGVRMEIEEIINQNGIGDRVRILDWIDFARLYEFMLDYQVFIHPSCYTETRDCEGGAPVVLLDAQATGMPVLSTNHCDIPDEVVNGKTGYLTPEKDIEALAGSIKTFYEMDNETYQSFASNARKHMEENYNVRRNSVVLKQIYDECIRSE